MMEDAPMEDLSVCGYAWAPPFVHGLVRDLRVRWALREAELPYNMNYIAFGEHKSPQFLARHPFGQVPTFKMNGTELFESGAIVYAIGLRSEKLLPLDEEGRLRTISWMFAALNTVEPPISALPAQELANNDRGWARLSLPDEVAVIDERLSRLSDWLGQHEFLADRFTCADILMTTVLRELRSTDILEGYPLLAAYVRKCEARRAFKEALDEQIGGYLLNAPLAA
jgi:glutathione S-transferase